MDTAATGLAGPAGVLFVVGTGVLGLCLGFLAGHLTGRLLPQYGVPNSRTQLTTAVLTGVVAALLALRFGWAWELPAYLPLLILGVQLTRIDLSHRLLPNALVVPLLAAGLVLLTAAAGLTGQWSDLLRALIGGVLLFVLYLVLALASPGALGMGDVKLAAPLGLFLGFLGWTPLFYGGALGFVAGGLVSALLLRTRRAGKASHVAFGPAMLAAAFCVILLLPA
jgi:leader peptidase (prepilin peptidase) / N-methyltransferase